MPFIESHILSRSGLFLPSVPNHYPRRSGVEHRHVVRAGGENPASFLANAIADIKQGHVVFPEPSENGSPPINGKRYIKHPELTNPPMI